MSQSSKGLVTRATGSWYDVLNESGETIQCRMRGKMRLREVRSTNPVVVGDWVWYTTDEQGANVIHEVETRRNYIIRRASNLSKESHIIAANLDQALLVATLHSPSTPTEFIDRFLITCEAYKIPAIIVLSKIDIQIREQIEIFKQIYGTAGYRIIEVSAKCGDGISEIDELLTGRTTLIAGNSGVGKSSIIGAIDPTLDIRTGEISSSHHKGKHTTTFSTMYPLKKGGYIIDTPGIKGFGLIDIDQNELWHYLPEMISRASECQFYNCTHTHEPHCAVVDAVERGEIAYPRYESYLKILNEDEKYRK